MSLELQALREAERYALKRPRRVVSANSDNYPALRWLFRNALQVRSNRPKAKQFTHEGVRYCIVWLGKRMAVMHVRTGLVLVGAPGVCNE
jgi:hypothetical protein